MSRVVRPPSAFGVRPMTKLQRARHSERVWAAAKLAVIERDNYRCIRCGDIGVEVHHRMNRGAGGSNTDPNRTHQKSRLALLCRDCHRWVGTNPLEAEASGLLVRRGVIHCDQVPVEYLDRGLVLLTDECQIKPISAVPIADLPDELEPGA